VVETKGLKTIKKRKARALKKDDLGDKQYQEGAKPKQKN